LQIGTGKSIVGAETNREIAKQFVADLDPRQIGIHELREIDGLTRIKIGDRIAQAGRIVSQENRDDEHDAGTQPPRKWRKTSPSPKHLTSSLVHPNFFD
jgi:hypothetical protein